MPTFSSNTRPLFSTATAKLACSLVGLAPLLGALVSGCADPDEPALSDAYDPIVSTPAFPGAEGFGAMTPGGRGGTVLTVSTLAASGPGSFAWAVQQPGPRIVVFNVEGRIELTDQLQIEEPYITIAGQTAPGQGVVISGARLRIKTHDVIVRGLKLRAADDPDGDTPRNRDNLSLAGGADDVIIDGNSLTWSVDESAAIWGTVKNVTFSNNIIAEALKDSIHIDEGASSPGPHSMGMIVGGSAGSQSEKISIVKNLFASNQFRNPFVKQARKVELYNNYVSNYGSAHQGLKLGGGGDPVTAAVVGNRYEDGNDTSGDSRPPFDFRSLDGGSVYLSDNSQQGHSPNSFHGGGSHVVGSMPFSASNTNVMSSSAVPAHVLANAGARVHGQLDPVDSRIVAEVTQGTTSIIDSPSEVGGFGVYSFSGATYADGDGDGMPDAFEDQYGLDTTTDDSAADSDGDGYTNIEEYINGRITGVYDLGGTPSDPPSDPPTGPPGSSFVIEAEDMALSGFSAKSSGIASGGAWIQTKGSGTASTTFAGEAGSYDLEVAYFDENDGVSTMQLSVNGVVQHQWDWDQQLGSKLANATTLTSMTVSGVALAAGDVVTLSGTSDGAEPLRTDAVTFTLVASGEPLEPVDVEAEDMALTGFSVKANGVASGGAWIQTNGSGTAAYAFDGGSGSYDLVVHYFDENDGVSQMEVLVNGVLVHGWSWSDDLGSNLANASTATSLVISGLQLSSGDVIELSGQADGSEPLRTDRIELLPQP